VLLGKLSTRPPSWMVPGCATTSVVAGSEPVKSRYMAVNVSTDAVSSTWAWFGSETFVAPVIDELPRFCPHTATVGTPPGSDVAVAPSRFA
jgi:hypothetical protein